jgi:hypothetical protein
MLAFRCADSVVLGTADHIEDGLLEAYAVGNAPAEALEQFGQHLQACAQCRQRLRKTRQFVRDLQAALKTQPVLLESAHLTEHGSIRVAVKTSDSGDWLASVSGPDIETLQHFPKEQADAAVQYALRTFTELFPEHKCTAGCRAAPQKSPTKRKRKASGSAPQA